MDTCENSGLSIKDWLPNIRKPIFSGKGKEEFIEDYKLTRYACYLIAQNGDSRKKVYITEKLLMTLLNENI